VVTLISACTCFSRRDKINELNDWMRQLESEKFDHMERLKKQKYEVRLRLHTTVMVTVWCSIAAYRPPQSCDMERYDENHPDISQGSLGNSVGYNGCSGTQCAFFLLITFTERNKLI